MHVRVLADQGFHVLLHLLDRFHLEPDVVRPRARRVLPIIVADLPRNDHQRDAPVAEIEILVLPVQRRQPEHLDIEGRAFFRVPRADRDVADMARPGLAVDFGISVLLHPARPCKYEPGRGTLRMYFTMAVLTFWYSWANRLTAPV